MVAPKGNTYNVNKALTHEEHKHKAYKSLCEHLADGYAFKSWSYVDGEFMCSYKTMEKYMEENPQDFPPLQREIAYANGYKKWEKVVSDSGTGSNKKANTASLQMIMRNKYGWDTRDKEDHNATKGDIDKLLKEVAKQPTVKGE